MFLFKHSLPVFAFLLLAVIIVWPQFIQDKEKFNLPSVEQIKSSPDVNLENVRFFSQDPKHKKITTVSEKIVEIDAQNNIVRLEKPIATYMLNSGETITARTPYGLAYQNDKYMFFEDRVNATTNNGYVIQASQVKMTYDGMLDSDSPIAIRGPAGTLNAQGIHLINKGEFVHFKKKSTAHINSKQGKLTIISQEGMDVNRTKQTVTAKKDVRITNEGKVLTSDTVILYYIGEKETRIDRIEAIGHVVVLDKENKITADKMTMYYTNDKKNEIKSILAQDNVVASNAKNKISGDTGEYIPATQIITVTGDVVLHQGKSFVKGTKAKLDMATGKSTLQNEEETSSGKKKGRITGTFMPQEFKN